MAIVNIESDSRHIVLFDGNIIIQPVVGNFEWSDKAKRRGLVYWRSPQQLGQDIYQWVASTGQTGTVMTTAEIVEEGDTNSWRGVSQEVVIRALQTLQADKKCEIFDGDDGVKFF